MCPDELFESSSMVNKSWNIFMIMSSFLSFQLAYVNLHSFSCAAQLLLTYSSIGENVWSQTFCPTLFFWYVAWNLLNGVSFYLLKVTKQYHDCIFLQLGFDGWILKWKLSFQSILECSHTQHFLSIFIEYIDYVTKHICYFVGSFHFLGNRVHKFRSF